MELDALKGEQVKYHEVEKEMMDLRKLKSECELVKWKENNTTQENKKLVNECHSLELQLTKFGECHKQLEETNLEKKKCEKSKSQLEIEVKDLKREQSECDLLKQKREDMTREKKKLLDENHNLELQLIKFDKCHKQLEKTNSDKRICESLKEDLVAKNHHKELEMVALKKENKFLHSQLHSEQQMNKKLRAEKNELQLLYDALESHFSKEKIDKAKLEVGNNTLLIVLVSLISLIICCLRCGDHDERVYQKVAAIAY